MKVVNFKILGYYQVAFTSEFSRRAWQLKFRRRRESTGKEKHCQEETIRKPHPPV
jgi:hypothetical protein